MMTRAVKIALCYIWCGLVIGISFLEAPLKFTAPNVTLEIGLGIGQIVFGTLNKFEIGISAILIVLFLLEKKKTKITWFFLLPISVLIIQSLWLLPILDQRIDLILAGNSVPENSIHFIYVFMEVLKLLCLLIIGWFYLKENLRNEKRYN